MHFPWSHFLVIFAVALVVSMAITPLARRIAVRLNAVDYPNARRINKVPVPRMGGLAMFLGLVAALITQYCGTLLFDWPSAFISHPSMSINYWGLAISVLVIFSIGAIDDVKSLKPIQKLAGQLVAGCIAAASGLLIGNIVNPFGPGEMSLGIWAYPITVFYLVAFANIINLIDGLDGLAAGISAIVGISMFGITLMSGRVDAASLAIATAGSALGFLRYNFHPAKIFMGDSGSLMLGFVLGIVSLLGVTRVTALTTLLVPLIIAGVPIIDTFAAIVRRLRGHISIGHADKGHIQHRLIDEGFDQRQAALLIYAWSALLSLGAFVITQVSVGPRIAIFFALLAVTFLFVKRLRLFEPVLRHYYDPDKHVDEILPADDPVFTQDEPDAEGANAPQNAEEDAPASK